MRYDFKIHSYHFNQLHVQSFATLSTFTLYSHYHHPSLELLHFPQVKLYYLIPLYPPKPQQLSFYLSLISLSAVCTVSEITHLSFCNWLISLRIMFSRHTCFSIPPNFLPSFYFLPVLGVLGVKPRALHVLSKHSELHPRSPFFTYE